MEPLGAISELNWNFPDESEVIMAQLLGAYSDMNEQDQEASFGIDPMVFPGQDATSSCSFFDNLASCWLDAGNTTSSTSSFFFPRSEFQSNEMGDSNTVSGNSLDYFTSEEQMTGSSLMVDTEYQVDDRICSKDGENENEPKDYVTNTNAEATVLSDHTSQAKREFLEPENGNSTESPKKKARAKVRTMNVQESTKNARSKKAAQKNAVTGEEALSNASCSSDDESNTSQELTQGESSSAKGKTRAGHGSATDPQYARKRRERINERLGILQNLVPNGTKVDISTMLEEAVQYVKFLQLQIKLLSSDDLWMYAPLAYNGMDIGLDLKIPLPRQ